MRTQIDDPAAAGQNLVNAHFEEVASEWAEIYERQGVREFVLQERLRIVLDMVGRLDLPSRTRVLEIGSGAGFGALGLAKMGYAVDAIDPVQAMVDTTRERARRAGLDQYVRSGLGDVHALDFPNETFDLVLALGVLPWLPSLQQPLQEMCRVLRQGGYLIVTADNSWGLQNFLEPLTNPILRPTKELARRLLIGSRQRRARGYRISLRQCDGLLDASGLEKVESLTLGFGPFTFFNRKLFPWPLGLTVHHRLQALANSGLPVLRSGGSEYIVLVKKRGATMREEGAAYYLVNYNAGAAGAKVGR
jgi:ubiquinone/menaquinone biosynthesis C-methylase UbiE